MVGDARNAGSDDLLFRDGLPQQYRFLLAMLPRATWPSSRLDPLAQHWLEVHDWYRALHRGLIDIGRARTDRRLEDRDYCAMALPRLAHLLQHLDLHHHIETRDFFPALTNAEPRMKGAFELLDRDHEVIDASLADIRDRSDTIRVLAGRGEEDRDRIGHLIEAVERLERPLLRHFADEEDVIVPQLTLRAARQG